MKKTHIILSAAILLFAATSCNNNSTKTENSNQDSAMVDMHNAQNALDWEGSYFGVLPCASCPGINTLITLNADSTYEKTVEYLESDDTPETTKGKFQWDKDGKIITIGESTYLVGENQLFALDMNNKVIEGELADNYILTKTKLQPDEDVNEGYTPQTFTGSDNKEYHVLFNTNPKIPTATIESENFKKTLSQTQAWAKGAEYSGAKTKLTVQGENATLEIDGKKIDLKEKK